MSKVDHTISVIGTYSFDLIRVLLHEEQLDYVLMFFMRLETNAKPEKVLI